MKRRATALALAAALTLALAAPAWAGNPHFVGDPVITVSGNTLTVTGKEAGLGNEDQIHVTLTADAQCVNPGGNNPQAGNKTTVSAAGDFPVQNGRATFELTATATFQPNCSPPMSVVFSNVVVEDAANGLRFP
jgi:hypothetical protein